MSPNVSTKPSFAADAAKFQQVAAEAKSAGVISQKTLDDIVADPFLSKYDMDQGGKLVKAFVGTGKEGVARNLMAAAEAVWNSQGRENAIGYTEYKDANVHSAPTGLAGQRLPSDPPVATSKPVGGFMQRMLQAVLG